MSLKLIWAWKFIGVHKLSECTNYQSRQIVRFRKLFWTGFCNWIIKKSRIADLRLFENLIIRRTSLVVTKWLNSIASHRLQSSLTRAENTMVCLTSLILHVMPNPCLRHYAVTCSHTYVKHHFGIQILPIIISTNLCNYFNFGRASFPMVIQDLTIVAWGDLPEATLGL